MKDLQDAKVGDLMFDLEHENCVVDEIEDNGLYLKFENDTYIACDFNGCRCGNRSVFYRGQITENEYLGTSADGVKMFYGMKAFSFHLASENRGVTEFIARDGNKLIQHNVYSAAYSTKEAAEKAQKEHFKPEIFQLPDWFWVGRKIGFSTDRLMLAVNNDLGAIYQHGYTWYKASFPESKLKAHFVKAQFSELKNGDFFNLGADLNHILLKICDREYVKITNEGEVRNQNLGKFSEVLKVVASEVEREVQEPQKVAIGTLSVGEKFSFELNGDYNEIFRKESDSTFFKDPYGFTFENSDPSGMVYKI